MSNVKKKLRNKRKVESSNIPSQVHPRWYTRTLQLNFKHTVIRLPLFSKRKMASNKTCTAYRTEHSQSSGTGEDPCKVQAAVGWPPPFRNLGSLIHRSSSMGVWRERNHEKAVSATSKGCASSSLLLKTREKPVNHFTWNFEHRHPLSKPGTSLHLHTIAALRSRRSPADLRNCLSSDGLQRHYCSFPLH